MSQKISDFTLRPGLGRLGHDIKVRANFFEVTSLPIANIHHYDVTIIPEVPPTLNRKIYTLFEELHSGRLGRIRSVYDGRKNLYSSKQLPFGEADAFDVTLPEDNSTPESGRPPRFFKLIIRKVAVIDMEELHRFLNGIVL